MALQCTLLLCQLIVAGHSSLVISDRRYIGSHYSFGVISRSHNGLKPKKTYARAISETAEFQVKLSVILYRAVEADNVEIVRVILDTERGRETISWCDNEGRNVFHYAVKHLRVLEYLLKVYITVGYQFIRHLFHVIVGFSLQDAIVPLI